MAELAFAVLNLAVLPPWALMILAPRSAWTARLLASPRVPLMFAAIYVALLPAALVGGGAVTSLADLHRALEGDVSLLLAWTHYLAFDLMVGRAILRDALEREIGHARVAPCLALTLMLGPSGLLAYAAVRWRRTGALAP